jgi:glycosyltransferase involved in cell wall biosynthesis
MPKWVQDIYMPTIAKWTLESAERIICYTKEDAEAVMDLGIGEGRIAIIHNGVDIELFSPQYREPSDEVRLVWSGRFVPGKGVDTLIDAFALALKENPKLHLLLVGDGPQKDQIEAQIARLKVRDKVTINTYVPNNEMPDVYRSSSIFVLTSHYEGVPRTILESMACGLPVICTDLPQLRPIVGGNGILVPVYSAKGFAEAIVALASDESMRRRMGASGSELIRRNYSWDSAMRETIELYKTVIEERKRPR